MSFSDIADVVAFARDIALLFLLLIAILTTLLLYRKVAGLLDSIRRTVRDAEEMVSTVSERIVRPAAAGSGVALRAGRATSFIFGLFRRKKKGGSSNGK